MTPEGLDVADSAQLAVFVGSIAPHVSEDLWAVVHLATDRDAEFYDSLDLDDGMKVIAAVVEVNRDFFHQNVMPLLDQYLPAVTESLKETPGQTQ
jgi:hypothetical protein